VRRAAGPAGSSSDAPSGRRRGSDRGERSPDRSERADRAALTDPVARHDRSNGSGPTTAHPARSPRREAESPEDRFRVIATSPSVGPFRPGRELRRGARVREGDRLGTVDLLGVPQEVVAPADGIVMAILVEADEAVEYGQPLVELERASGTSGTSTASGAGSTPAGAGEG
ncbi:MAG TPA: biotin/lipoyl-containing protein, partial [Candidatus Limnocylindrales bacterium]